MLENPSELLVKYSISYLNKEVIVDTFKKRKTEKLNLNEVIPGLALGMKGMRVGEQREILIHPSVGYGIFTSLQKGVFLKVKVQLVDILAQNKQKNTFEDLGKNGLIDLEKDLNSLGILEDSKQSELNKSSGFSYGYYVWEHYKKENSYSLEQVLDEIKHLSQKTNLYIDLTKEDQSLLNYLHWTLYQKPNQDS